MMEYDYTILEGWRTPMSPSAIVRGLPDLAQRILHDLTEGLRGRGIEILTCPCCRLTTRDVAYVLSPSRLVLGRRLLGAARAISPSVGLVQSILQLA